MTSYIWDETYAVDVEILDQQHKVIFDSFRKISSAMADGSDGGIVCSLLDAFDIYCKVHFFDEERVMETAGFPLLELHRTQHELFINHLELFKASPSFDVKNAQDEFVTIAEWFIRHVVTYDREYADFLKRW
jgi:hemerythrin